MTKHQVGDLVFYENAHESELGVVIKIWTREEIKDYFEFDHEVYFPESNTRDRFRSITISKMKRDLESRILDNEFA